MYFDVSKNDKMTQIFDVTKVFWKFIAAVVHLPYSRVQKTKMFALIQECVFQERQFLFVFDGIQFFHNNINTLMYETLAYLQSKPQYVEEAALLQMALHKIEAVVECHDAMERLASVNMMDTGGCVAKEDGIIQELDGMLAGLSIV